MSTREAQLAALTAEERRLETLQDTDIATLATAQAALSSGDFSKLPPRAAPQSPAPKLGSGHYAAQGALAEAAMNKRFAEERAAEAKTRQKSPTILQRIANFFRNIAKKIKDFFNSKDKKATTAMPEATVPPAAPSLADRVIRGAQAEAAFYERVAQRRAAEERANRPNLIIRMLAFLCPSNKSTTVPANTTARPTPPQA